MIQNSSGECNLFIGNALAKTVWLYGFDCSPVPQGVIVLPGSAFKSHTAGKDAKNAFAWRFKNLETYTDNYLVFSCLRNVENGNLSKTKSERSPWHPLTPQQAPEVFRLVWFFPSLSKGRWIGGKEFYFHSVSMARRTPRGILPSPGFSPRRLKAKVGFAGSLLHRSLDARIINWDY